MEDIHPAELSHCLFTEANDAFLIFNPQTLQILDVNPTSERLTGIGRKKLLTMELPQLLVSPDDQCRRDLTQSFASTSFFHSREGYYLNRPGKPPLAVNVSVSRLHGEHQVMGLLVVRDVSDRKESEESLIAANGRLQEVLDELQQSQSMLVRQERLRALGEMASGAAHALNNLLTPLVGYTDLLSARGDLDDEAQQQVKWVSKSVRDLASVVRRLQLVRTPERESREVFSLEQTMSQVRSLTRPMWHDDAQRRGREINFELEIASSPSAIGDATVLRQALINLIFNAVEAMPAGGKIAMRLSNDASTACIEVADSGVGMDGQQIERCVDPFYTTKEQGPGLGLSICEGIAQAMGGKLEVESQVGHGTVVRLYLPIHEVANADSSGSPTPDAGKRNEVSPDLRILYIDDDDDVRRSFEVIAISCGWQVDLAKDGPSGKQRLQDQPYDVVITDFGMRGMNGKEVTRVAKELQPKITVIVISGWDESVVAEHFADSDVQPDSLISKPATLESLEAVLAAVGKSHCS